MRLTRLIPFAVASLAIGLGVAGNANAEAYATTFQDIQNGSLTFAPFPGDFVPPAVINTSTSTQADLNGGVDADADPLDAQPANAPPSNPTRLNNVFNFFGPLNQNYSNGDAEIVTEQITNPIDGSVIQPFRARNIAESDVIGNSTASADGNVGSLTGLNFQFTIAGTTTIQLAFDNDPFMRSFLSADADVGSSATGGIKAVATLTDPNGNTVFTWAPNSLGTVVDFTGTAVVLDDEANINRNLPNAAPGSDFVYDPIADGTCAGAATAVRAFVNDALCNYALQVSIGPGNGGNAGFGQALGVYTLDLQAEETTDVTSVSVPEPTTLGLLGLGMLGMGFVRRTARKA